MAFKVLFLIDVEAFYTRLKSDYSASEYNKVLPSEDLTLQDIFATP